MQIYIAAVKIGAIRAKLLRQIIFAVPIDVRFFRMENLPSPSIVYGHVNFLYITIWLIRLEQVINTIFIGCENIRKTIIHAFIHIKANIIAQRRIIIIVVSGIEGITTRDKRQLGKCITAMCSTTKRIIQGINHDEILVQRCFVV